MVRQYGSDMSSHVQLDADDVATLFFVRGRGAMQTREVERIAREKGISSQQVRDAFAGLSGVETGLNVIFALPLAPFIMIRERVGAFLRSTGR